MAASLPWSIRSGQVRPGLFRPAGRTRRRAGSMARFVLDPKLPPQMSASDLARLDSMTEGEVEAAALADPDNPPMTEADLDRLAGARRIQSVRKRTGLSQARFAAAYRINVARL